MFKRYDSIENSYREKHVAKCFSAIARGHCSDDFVVEEKAHGANFSFYFDGIELKTACRTTLLENDGEGFFKSHLIKKRYAGKIRELYSVIGGSKETIWVVGELIGGSYHHPDVEKDDSNVPQIQKGVEYCPGHEFYAFDLFFLVKNEQGDASHVAKLDKLEMNAIFEQVGMLFAKPLYRGKLEDCLHFSNSFKSHIPGWLGLPEHPDKNLAEGKVIKPVRFASFGNGKRVILKDKAESFAEVAYGPTPRDSKRENMPKDLSEKGKELFCILRGYLTENRLYNVLSKIPNLGNSSKELDGRACGLLSQDAFEDFKKENEQEFDALGGKERKAIRKQLTIEAMELVQATLG